MSNRLKRRRKRQTEQQRHQLFFHFMLRPTSLHFRLIPYWQRAAAREGYASIAEAIVGIYRETGSLQQTADRLTFSRWTIRNKLADLGEPINAPGGPNNPYGRAGKPTEEIP